MKKGRKKLLWFLAVVIATIFALNISAEATLTRITWNEIPKEIKEIFEKYQIKIPSENETVKMMATSSSMGCSIKWMPNYDWAQEHRLLGSSEGEIVKNGQGWASAISKNGKPSLAVYYCGPNAFDITFGQSRGIGTLKAQVSYGDINQGGNLSATYIGLYIFDLTDKEVKLHEYWSATGLGTKEIIECGNITSLKPTHSYLIAIPILVYAGEEKSMAYFGNYKVEWIEWTFTPSS